MVGHQLGVHALVFAGGTTPDEITRSITQAKQAGFDILELSLHDLGNLDVSRTKAELEAANLGVVCSRGLAFDADISSSDPAVVSRGAQLLQESLNITSQLGGTLFTGALYSALGKYAHPLSPAGRANVVRVLRELAEEANHRGMELGIEVCNRYETNVVNTAAQAMDLAEDIGHDNVRIHLDIYHMNIEEADFVGPVLRAGKRLGYVHVGENHRGYLGSGHLDFSSFFRALKHIDYTGAITFESFSSAVVSPTLTNDLAIWRDLWRDGPALARHARQFLATALEATGAGD
ncbi:MAG: sugar phosphate isomerase/epimerase family protein [Arachnia sp.]